MSFKLDPSRAIASELPRVIRRTMADAIADVGRQRATVAWRIHRARISTKKLRAALKLARSADQKFCRREDSRLRQAARKLARLRDADAVVNSFTMLLKSAANRRLSLQLLPIRRRLWARRRTAQPSLPEMNRQLRDFAADLRSSARGFSDWRPELDFDDVVDGYRRSYRRARRAFRRARAKPSVEAFHSWRKATNAYAYQCRLLRAAWPPAMKELRRELEKLAGCLGDEHDCTLIEVYLDRSNRKGEFTIDGGKLLIAMGILAARRAELRVKAMALGERLFVDRSATIARRIERWWRVAQNV